MNVLAIGCHPDDVEICCAGTLAKCVKRGDKVIVAHLCTGSLGHVVIPPEELVPMRAAEAREAGKLAGIEVLDGVFGDLDLYADNAESRNKVVEIIQYAQPDFIITQNPDDYMPDHVATSKLVFDAAFTATLPNWPSKTKKAAKLVPIYYMDTLAGVNFVPDECSTGCASTTTSTSPTWCAPARAIAATSAAPTTPRASRCARPISRERPRGSCRKGRVKGLKG